MYPAHLLSLFPPFPRSNRVFVAMSFAEEFQQRWETVIAPGIRDVTYDGKSLEPHRVDLRTVGDSIVSEIVRGIAEARLVIADVSAVHVSAEGSVFRNANVMYEVGIAHASRLPEEVLLFRSDDRQLVFDLASVRVLGPSRGYAPDSDITSSRRVVAEAIKDALREVDLRRALAVQQATNGLDGESFDVLVHACGPEGMRHPPQRTVGDRIGHEARLRSISRLLDLGLIQAEYPTSQSMASEEQPVKELVVYRPTAFGACVLAECVGRFTGSAGGVRHGG